MSLTIIQDKKQHDMLKTEFTTKVNAIWAILFACGKSVLYDDLETKLNLSNSELKSVITELRESLKTTPLMLLETENSIKLVTKPEYATFILNFISTQPKKLSDAALETLAIIIHKQPCTRQEIENIRNTDSEKALSTLVSAGLVKPIGNIRQTGSPILYSITDECLFKFGVRSYKELLAIVEEIFNKM